MGGVIRAGAAQKIYYGGEEGRALFHAGDMVWSHPLVYSSQIYLDGDDSVNGPVSSITTRGDLALTFSASGTGDEVYSDDGGLHFYAGQYLRCTTGIPSTEYSSAIILLDMTINGDPTGTPYVMWLDASPQASLCQARYGNKDNQTPSAGFLMSSFGPGNASMRTGIYKAIGHRFTTAHGFDFVEGEMSLTDEDGYTDTQPTEGVPELMVMTDLRIGQGCRVSIHRLAVILEPAE